MKGYIRSTKRLAMTNNVVPISTIALITGKSLENTDSISRFPTPGIPKNRSTMNDVNAKLASASLQNTSKF